MAEEKSTEKPKPTAEQKAEIAGKTIYRNGYNQGKSEGRKESGDPDAKRAGYLVTGAVKMKAKGKNSTTKQLRNLANNITDENDYGAIEALVRKSVLMFVNATKPVKEKEAQKTETPPTTS